LDSRCHVIKCKNAKDLRIAYFQATAMAARHMFVAACFERKLCAGPALLNLCILRSRRRVGLRILGSIVAQLIEFMAFFEPMITGCGSIRS
jgi:hypothetical protein